MFKYIWNLEWKYFCLWQLLQVFPAPVEIMVSVLFPLGGATSRTLELYAVLLIKGY